MWFAFFALTVVELVSEYIPQKILQKLYCSDTDQTPFFFLTRTHQWNYIMSLRPYIFHTYELYSYYA